MTKRLVDINDELLQDAAGVLGTRTMKDTVNRALEEVREAGIRRAHVARLERMRGTDLSKPKVMRRAWR